MKARQRIVALLAAFLIASAVGAQVEDPFQAGKALFEKKQYAEARAKFQEALKYVPDDPSVWSWIGACHMALAEFPEAEKAIRTAIEKGGTSYGFFERLVASQVRQSKWEAALSTIGWYRQVAPDEDEQENDEKLRTLEAALHLERRLECLRRSPPDVACGDAELEAAWQLRPKEPAPYASFAPIWMSKALAEKDPARRVTYFERAEAAARTWLTVAPDADKLKAKSVLGTALARQKKYDEAIPLLDETRRADPQNCAVRLELARAHLGKEDFTLAKMAASEAIACAPEDAQGYLLRGMAEHGLDDCASVVRDGAEYAKRAPGKDEPKFVTYCKDFVAWQRQEVDRQKRLEDYKKWVQQQLEHGPEDD